MADEPDAAQVWEERYAGAGQVWSGRVNPTLAAAVDGLGLAPATALELGCGEGGDTVWLAGRGWRVLAVDISPTALERTQAGAAAAGVGAAVRTERHDLARTFPAGRYDLVCASFLHSHVPFPRADVLRRALAAVAPGGVLVIVGHAAPPPWSALAHDHDVHLPTPAEEVEALALTDAFEVVRADTVDRTGSGPDGRSGHLTDVVVVIRRRP